MSAAVIRNAELQERELIKLAKLSAALTGVLRRRGIADPAEPGGRGGDRGLRDRFRPLDQRHQPAGPAALHPGSRSTSSKPSPQANDHRAGPGHDVALRGPGAPSVRGRRYVTVPAVSRDVGVLARGGGVLARDGGVLARDGGVLAREAGVLRWRASAGSAWAASRGRSPRAGSPRPPVPAPRPR